MAYNHPLDEKLKNDRWKIKIRDRERTEDPHVTVLRNEKAWRVSLRDLRLLDGGNRKELAPVLAIIKRDLDKLIQQWDLMYPENPVSSQEKVDDENS